MKKVRIEAHMGHAPKACVYQTNSTSTENRTKWTAPLKFSTEIVAIDVKHVHYIKVFGKNLVNLVLKHPYVYGIWH